MGLVKLLENAIHYVRRGGTLVPHGAYASSARMSWPLAKILGEEIRIIDSFSDTFMFPATVECLDNGKVESKRIMTKRTKLKTRSRTSLQ